MARVYYEALNDDGAAKLASESSRRRCHSGMILIFETGVLASREGGVDFARIRDVVASHLPDLPRLRSKLRRVPIEGHPVWVDDPEFDLDYHLRHSALPRPGNREQLCKTISRIGASRLDRSRPLWECWVLEGLEGGRFALVFKIHQALDRLEGSTCCARSSRPRRSAKRLRPFGSRRGPRRHRSSSSSARSCGSGIRRGGRCDRRSA